MSSSKLDLTSLLRSGESLSLGEQIALTLKLSWPAIMANFAAIAMEYIDASMVGRLGALPSASIGLVATTTWLFGGFVASAASGFSVQVAHLVGAGKYEGARDVLRQSLIATGLLSLLVMLIGCLISGQLPVWLGGNEDIHADASAYFFIFALSMPLFQMRCLAGGMIRCSGNMVVPGTVNVVMCILDILFNYLLIFPSKTWHILDWSLTIPGAGMGVLGAALGTLLAELFAAAVLLWYACCHSNILRLLGRPGKFRLTRDCMSNAFKIGAPIALEHVMMNGAQILTTVIVAPLGTFAIAANSFAITAESLCYMPGYGIGEAATTLVGQCIGAKRVDLTRRFAHLTVYVGMVVMTLMALVMFVGAPYMMQLMTPNVEVSSLGAVVLRIEAFAEPMFAASIVAHGVFVGAGDTMAPSLMNLFSIWFVRLSLAALLAPVLGLQGVWIAMCVELCFRGVIYLVRLYREKWMNKIGNLHESLS